MRPHRLQVVFDELLVVSVKQWRFEPLGRYTEFLHVLFMLLQPPMYRQEDGRVGFRINDFLERSVERLMVFSDIERVDFPVLREARDDVVFNAYQVLEHPIIQPLDEDNRITSFFHSRVEGSLDSI